MGTTVALAESEAVDPASLTANSKATRAETCAEGFILSSGPPDRSLFSALESSGLRGHWCESYDARGRAKRAGRYWEADAAGRIRTRATYVDSRLAGPVVAFHENGAVFMRGFLSDGEWEGTFELFDERGVAFFEAEFRTGRLDGLVRTRHPDGRLGSEARYQSGREDGLARSFYGSAAGGGLKSEAHIEADEFVGVHRLFDRQGQLRRTIDWNGSPISWREPTPQPVASPSSGSREGNVSPAAPRNPGPAPRN